MWLGTAAKPYLFQGINEFQKVNHFPCSSEITRKDRLCENLVKM
jgi:tubulin polyglutamylase TTLL5